MGIPQPLLKHCLDHLFHQLALGATTGIQSQEQKPQTIGKMGIWGSMSILTNVVGRILAS